MISKKLTIEFLTGEKLLTKANRIYIASASVTEFALDLLLRNVSKDAEIHFLIGIDLPSDRSALERLMMGSQEGKWQFRVYVKSFFHPKLYMLEGEEFSKVYIGSGNFTKGGWKDNVELFHVEDEKDTFNEYKWWFITHFDNGLELEESVLNLICSQHIRKRTNEQEDKKGMDQLRALLTRDYNIDTIDFSGQFFDREHHEIFSPQYKCMENLGEVKVKRRNIRKRLYDLHDLIWPEIQLNRWKLHPHYITDDIVSSMELSFHGSHEIASMWLHYGRDKNEIKEYGQEETPLHFSRLQVIVHYDHIGIWLRFGKPGGSRLDREHFHDKMKGLDYRKRFYEFFAGLGNQFWIRIGEEIRTLTQLNTIEKLHEFTKTDNWRQDYFIIGTSYHLGHPKLKEESIVNTVLNDFGKLYPLYHLMKDKTFTNNKDFTKF